jgi:putative nucleotidyltransferase with HDIG domain
MIFFAGQDEGKSLALVAHSGIANGLPALFAGVALTWSEDRPFGKGPIGRAIRTGEIAVGRDLRNDPALALFAPFAAKHGLRSKVAVPLKDAAGTLGALVILDAADEFDEGAIPVLRELATDLTFGIRTLRIRNEHGAALHQLEQNMESTVQAIGRAVEFRDPYTSGHQHRVAKLAGAIGQEMELSRDEVRAIRIASLVHDVGKIYVPAEILTKPGDLSKLEFDLIKIHAQAGAEILESIEFPWPVAKTVRQHHERLDGSGYPDSLRGDDILLSARVIAVADVMESMMTHRPYRPAHSVQDALAELGAGRGRLYDARAVDACVKLFKQFSFD